ncbi:MAG: DUF4357 domain-containing protein, partial [Nitrospiraceae bacterium]|nr:DUF4357 domain-containing protein [Nitrospiraceae bacterium]
MALVSRTGSFTKAHGKLLEYMAIAKAKEAGRYELENGNAGGEPTMPEWMRADVMEVFETAEVLLGSLGYPVFESPAASQVRADVQIFYCRRGGSQPRGVYNEEGFVVLAGSVIRQSMVESASPSLLSQRDALMDSGAIVQSEAGLVFSRIHHS